MSAKGIKLVKFVLSLQINILGYLVRTNIATIYSGHKIELQMCQTGILIFFIFIIPKKNKAANARAGIEPHIILTTSLSFIIEMKLPEIHCFSALHVFFIMSGV